MANKKNVIDLSEVTEEQFENMQKYIADWKAGGCFPVSVMSESDIEDWNNELKGALERAYNNGVNHACIGSALTIVAFAAGVAVVKGVKYFKDKKAKEEVEE